MAKQTIILLHGALGSSSQLDNLKMHLSGIFDVFCFTFSGHGGLPQGESFNIKQFARELNAFMEANHISTSHFFGYSMGGYVALEFALNFPEKTGKIITLGTKFNWTPESAAAEIRQLDPGKIEAKVPAFAQMLAAIHGTGSWKKVVTSTADMMHALGNGAAITMSKLADIQREVLLLLAENDRMVTLEETQAAQDSLSNATLLRVPGAIHPIETADPVQLSATVNQFLTEM